MIQEIQLDGLIGPTHFFGGLASGNVASALSAGRVSHPRAAALQGLRKMKAVHDAGIPQYVMPPHPRPALGLLKSIGFSGSASVMMRDVLRFVPELLPVIYSSSAMWAANAATTCASTDAADRRVHITPANLISHAHRALEAPFTARLLKRIFPDDTFTHHAPLPCNPLLADEGAANHMRITPKEGKPLHVFVYGTSSATSPHAGGISTKRYLPRQQAQASYSVARLHQLAPERTLFLQQHPDAIDAGVFHNDVIAASNDHLLIYHEQALVDDAPLIAALQQSGEVVICKATARELSVAEAVKSYLFNSQILTRSDGSMLLLAPMECQQSADAKALIDRWVADPDHPVHAVQYIDINQSMSNGGGPACLRLRLWLTESEMKQVHSGVKLSNALFEKCCEWVESYYPEELAIQHLQDATLPARVEQSLLALEKILDIKGMYDGYF